MSLFKSKTLYLLLIIVSVIMVSCQSLPYTEDEILCDYGDLNCLYYVKNEYKEYKFSDYIIDDVSNGEYKTSTPSITDYKTGNGPLDYDIAAYVEARTDFALKKELIDKYEVTVTDSCARVRDENFAERNAYVYYYDKEKKENTLLYDGLVSNISYDDEVPVIWFDVNETGEIPPELTDGRKILLSDIIAANSTIDGYMRVLLGSGKTRYQFFGNKRIDNDIFYNDATSSEITENTE